MSDDVGLTWDQRDTLELLGTAATRPDGPYVREWTRARTVRPGAGRLARVRRDVALELEKLGLATVRNRKSGAALEWRATDRGLEILELRRIESR